ncbi:hypothetical protein GCM10009854_16940 [Saccharopolyspora halophila]|uniref:Uncharacterized protein n=1 Tax=Saccharopolyspora halophila TaxID=405551 RepID=A0ABP5SXR8_9PSEU
MVNVHHDRAKRSEIRAFVRDNHPDVGGDPEAFAAGLARLRAEPAAHDPRFEAPIVVRPGGARGLLIRVRAWWRRRRRPSRVR